MSKEKLSRPGKKCKDRPPSPPHDLGVWPPCTPYSAELATDDQLNPPANYRVIYPS
jgi:hypothetical protein